MLSAMSRKNSISRRSGFTLIELLVVVAIIVILIAVLMPSLANARQQARSLACLANLKSIGTAFATHLAENNDRYPVQPTTGGRGCFWDSAHPERNLTTTTWWGLLAPNLNWTKTDWSNASSPNYSDHSAARSVGQCPEFGDRIKGSFTYWANCYVVVDPDLTYVAGTWAAPKGWGTGLGLKATLVGRPSDKVLVYEVHTDSGWPITHDGTARGKDPFYDSADRSYSDGSRAVHGKNNNFLFCDGHAESIPDRGYPSRPQVEWPGISGDPSPLMAFRIEN